MFLLYGCYRIRNRQQCQARRQKTPGTRLLILFWVPPTLLFGFRSEYFAAALATIVTGVTTLFAAGGLPSVRTNRGSVPWFSWLYPNICAVDPMRDLVLFHERPADRNSAVVILGTFADGSATAGMLFARGLRRLWPSCGLREAVSSTPDSQPSSF